MALAVNRTGVILKKRDMSYPAFVKRCATAVYQSTWPAGTISKSPRGRSRSVRLAVVVCVLDDPDMR
jgi:hypothetical protein